jgi:K+-transporting ATPase ATPase C chain
MGKQLLPGFRITIVLTVLTGLCYPGVVTGLCQMLFPRQAAGSLITRGGRVVGSELIGQGFARPEYIQPRPSAAGANGYDASASGGSNLGPTSQKLADRVRASAAQFRRDNPAYQGPIPADLLTTSASGLDPHISPASALAQAARVAQARRVDETRVRQLIESQVEARDWGVLGEPRVNVLKVNLALDQLYPMGVR